ncbi:hypothetical protein RMATCC62417_12654 [Rhizopus microsporus]|nr:hypothetical protein RMATCC62417_12654 [Rhizopus microsporus]
MTLLKNSMKQDSPRELFQEQQTSTVEEEVFPTEDMVEDRDLFQSIHLEVFSREDEVVEPLEPRRSINSPQTIIQTVQPPAIVSPILDQQINYLPTLPYQQHPFSLQLQPPQIPQTPPISTPPDPQSICRLDMNPPIQTCKTIQVNYAIPEDGILPGGHNLTSLAFADSRGGIQVAIYNPSTSLKNGTSSSQQIGPTRNGPNSAEILSSRDYRGKQSPIILKPILLEILHHSRTNEEETYPGLQKIKPVYTSSAFQDGGCTRVKRIDRKKGLHSKIRSKGCLYRSSYSFKFKAILGVPKSGNHVQLPFSKLRIKYRSKNIFQTTKIRLGTVKKRGYSASLFSRRYLHLGSNKRTITRISGEDHVTSRVLRLYHKQEQKRTNTVTGSGLLEFHVRHQENNDKGTGEKDQELKTEVETSTTGQNEVVQVDGELNGKDDSNDTSSRGGSSTHKVSPQGSNQTICLVATGKGRNKVVAYESDGEERVTDPTTTVEESGYYHLHGQLRNGLGSTIARNQDARFLDRGGEALVNQRKRAVGHLFCSKAPCAKVPKPNIKNFHGQQDVHQIHHKGRRRCLSNPSGDCSHVSRFMQPVPLAGNLPTHPGSAKCGSRPVVQENLALVRTISTGVDIQGHTSLLGTTNSRYFCYQTEQESSMVLQLPSGSEKPRKYKLNSPRQVWIDRLPTGSYR